MNQKLLGSRINQAREDRGYSLDALASRVGLNKSTLSRYERGEIENPKLPVINAIANALHVNPGWLVGKCNDKSYTPAISGASIFSPSNLFSPLKTLRTARGLSVEEAAYQIGISSSHYLAIERGCNTDCITLARIANFFCCSVDFILAFDGVSSEDGQVSFTKDKLFRLHKAFECLSPEQQEQVIMYADNLTTADHSKFYLIRFAGRDGSYREFQLSDKQADSLKAILDQMPDVPDDL